MTHLPATDTAKSLDASQHFQLFSEGDTLYDAMLAAISSARQHVVLESYIFADDEIGERFCAALIERARAGVAVRLHLDAAGCLFWRSHRLLRQLKKHGIKIRRFHRWSWRHPWRYNRRNHRKLLVVDGNYAFVGGFNIHRENARSVYGEQRWLDAHVGFSGELAADAARLFEDFWLARKRRRIPSATFAGSLLLSNFGYGGRRALKGTIGLMLSQATRTIFLTTPYFVPDRHTQARLIDAANRGVDVRVLVPRKNDVRLAQWAARAAYQSLLDGGVKIFEYVPRVLHAKTIIVDGRYATVGTANLDYRSFFLNYELNLFTHDLNLCTQLQAQFLHYLAESEQIRRPQWEKRFWVDKALEFTGWIARRWL